MIALHDWQCILGDVQWIRPSVSVKSVDLKPIYDMLPGNTDLSSPRILTLEAKRGLNMLMQSIEQVHLQRVDYDKPIQLVLTSHFAPTGVFWQSGPIMWVYMPISPSRVVMPYYELVLKLL